MESAAIAAVAARARVPFVGVARRRRRRSTTRCRRAPSNWIDERGNRRMTAALRAAVDRAAMARAADVGEALSRRERRPRPARARAGRAAPARRRRRRRCRPGASAWRTRSAPGSRRGRAPSSRARGSRLPRRLRSARLRLYYAAGNLGVNTDTANMIAPTMPWRQHLQRVPRRVSAARPQSADRRRRADAGARRRVRRRAAARAARAARALSLAAARRRRRVLRAQRPAVSADGRARGARRTGWPRRSR